MSLSCTCYDDYEWYYNGPDEYTTLNTKNRRRCCSCNVLIEKGAICTEFSCYRPPNCDYEERRFGDEVPMADKYMCEECSDLYFSYIELGFCITLGHNMIDLVEEYQEYVKTRLEKKASPEGEA